MFFQDGEKRSIEKFPQTLTLNADFDFDEGVGKGLILKYVKLQGDYELEVGLQWHRGDLRNDDQENIRLILDPDR